MPHAVHVEEEALVGRAAHVRPVVSREHLEPPLRQDLPDSVAARHRVVRPPYTIPALCEAEAAGGCALHHFEALRVQCGVGLDHKVAAMQRRSVI
eukprot:4363756-Prymnesium_polylepis.2